MVSEEPLEEGIHDRHLDNPFSRLVDASPGLSILSSQECYGNLATAHFFRIIKATPSFVGPIR